jgi:hypothetical protein
MSAITEFFEGRGRDGSGRTLEEILRWSDGRLEDVHDYIQWLFPLPERSGANPWAPVLDAEDIAAFHRDAALRERLREGFDRMLAFYGLTRRDGEIVPTAGFEQHARHWLTPGNHNHLRLTRILRSLRVLGLEEEAQRLWKALETIHGREAGAGRYSITERTFAFWRRAATEPLDDWRSA